MATMTGEIFGVAADGAAIRAFDLGAGATTARVIEWGAALQDLRFGGTDRPLVLGFPTLADYEADAEHVGAVVGRCANRLSGGRFEIDGRAYRATRNVNGEEGFPGAVSARCVYRLFADGVEISLSATANAPTPVNLTHHAYFNLSGEPTIDGHELTVAADRLTPLGPDLTPTGAVSLVSPREDLRSGRRIGSKEIDVNYVLADAPRAAPAFAARVSDAGIAMTLETTAIGLQVYTGHNMPDGPLMTNGAAARPRAGLCLEPQFWPDAPNQPGFPSIILRPGETFAQTTRLRFEKL